MSYDPEERRDTPLARKLAARIHRHGPMTVRDYVRACLRDPDHGYYRTRNAIGAKGDFITGPEICQAFGELIGLWCAVVWQQMGSPRRVRLVELGPGRGTLMRDVLRAARIVPQFLRAADVVMFESSAPLKSQQKVALSDVGVHMRWLNSYEDLDFDVPAIVIANEFLDTFPADQIERVDGGWVLRRVGVDDRGRLVPAYARPLPGLDRPRPQSRPDIDRLFPAAAPGDLVERAQFILVEEALCPWPSVAALFIDYGHLEPLMGDTLQAVRNHRPEHFLTSPGEADLTHQVQFPFLFDRVRRWEHLAIDTPTTQAEFFGRLGMGERASRLMAANPDRAAEIEAGVARLMAPEGMGTRFKAVGVRSADLPPLPGFLTPVRS